MKQKRVRFSVMLIVAFFLVVPQVGMACSASGEYAVWKEVGNKAALQARQMMRTEDVRLRSGDAVVLSNAGYAEIDGRATTGALDGLAQTLKVGRGDHSLVEIHSAPEKALWFAVYHKTSGACAYLEVDPAAMAAVTSPDHLRRSDIFAVETLETINAGHLFANAAEFAEKFNNKIFGGNEFRIVTISNAVAVDAPTCAVRSFEFHDHYCPGVTSGIMIALYLKSFYPLGEGGKYFVHGVSPSCKEDALLVMLNTTPGKSGYGVNYPTAEDKAHWPDWAQGARNIVYRYDAQTGIWQGVLLGYTGGDTGCPAYGHSVMDKLCGDLWYLAHMDHPEDFVRVLYEFELPEGVTPKDYARPGVDPMAMLGLVE